MKFAKSVTTTAVLSLIALGNAWAFETRSFGPMFGDVHPTLGQEVVMPFVKLNDGNGDGYPESLNFSFKVFTAGTNTLLRQTMVKVISTPALPAGCNPAAAGEELELDFFPTRRQAQLNKQSAFVAANKRMTVAINMEVNCDSGGGNWVLSDTSFVYSADLSGTENGGLPGPTWTKVWPGKVVEGLNGLDVDGDLVNDHQVITLGGETVTGGWTFIVVYAEGKTGATNTTITTSGGASYTLPTSGKIYTVLP